ncbi:MAG TPA: hypothetical protein VFN48_10905 [Solirubrobacteraceae bacterium]|nr:hypothetical protein [Solirubrobacteraceae bacterium]
MADAKSKIPYLLERLAQGVAAHDRENPGHHTWGVGMAFFDIERLGLEEGEQILPGIVLQADGGVTGAFRVLCDGNHDADLEEADEERVDAVADTEQAGEEERELQPVRPGGPEWPGREREQDDDAPPPIRPPF